MSSDPTAHPRAAEPRSALAWNVIDSVQVVAALVAAISTGADPTVYGLLMGTLVRKVWPVVEALTSRRSRRIGLLALIASNVAGFAGHFGGLS